MDAHHLAESGWLDSAGLIPVRQESLHGVVSNIKVMIYRYIQMCREATKFERFDSCKQVWPQAAPNPAELPATKADIQATRADIQTLIAMIREMKEEFNRRFERIEQHVGLSPWTNPSV
jgi:hypothetical protein